MANDEFKTEMVIPVFDDIAVSTKTTIVMTNLTVNIKRLFEMLPITEYIVVPKRRGRKKKNTTVNPNEHIPNGSIITIEFENKIRGVRLKKKKKSSAKKGEDYFRNSITVVMTIDKKNINFKISRNGKFQLTGCKYDEHAEQCIRYIWLYIKDDKQSYKLKGNTLTALFVPAMRNIDFETGFHIDREKLDQYFNTQTDYCSLLETSIGYTGVNIKFPFKKPITELKLNKLTWDSKNDDWDAGQLVDFNEYLNLLDPKDKKKKIEKERYHTFLVFHSGKIIMSSICASFARDTYYEFMNIIKNNANLFKEHLDE